MRKLTSTEIRQLWIDFFKERGHYEIPSHSLVPQNDPSLLWINSGVAGLKPYFVGEKNPPQKELVNSQKSLRTNDIENVGLTSRHHTFFEMLGNFSIGGYFKAKAVEYAFEFLVKCLQMDKNLLYITCFQEDEETKTKWISLGIDPHHIFLKGRAENFWDLGLGPCGPCTEIFYDRGAKFDPENRGIALLRDDIENDRYIEVWNVVFSQYNNDGHGNYTELRQKNIDTGAGLERLAAIAQDCPTNFESDLFMPVVHEVEKYTSARYDVLGYFKDDPQIRKTNLAFRIVADHVRAACMAIADGVKPGNNSRAYIIRMLLRRALKNGIALGIQKPFLYRLCNVIQQTLPIYKFHTKEVAKIIKIEEEKFIKTIFIGEQILAKAIENQQTLDGEVAFKLYETYGYPVELTQEILAEKKIVMDWAGFKASQKKHTDASRSLANVGAMKHQIQSLQLIKKKISEFVGYEHLRTKTTIVALLDAEEEIEASDGYCFFIAQETPFYATSGGQKFDKGFVTQNHKSFPILDVFKDKNLNHVHYVTGQLNRSDPIELVVDEQKRHGAMRNHSATHLTFAALERILQRKFKQSGSSLDHTKLHLDFDSNHRPTDAEIEAVEAQLKTWIQQDIKTEVKFLTRQEMIQEKVTTLEGEDYAQHGNRLRSVKFGDFSYELCGGTHVPSTGFIENFIIKGVESKQAGVYRLTAITGNDLVNEYLTETTTKEEEVLQVLISKVRTLNPTFQLRYEKTIMGIRDAQAQAKAAFKRAWKNFRTTQPYDLADVEKFVKNNHNFVVCYKFKSPLKIREAGMRLQKEHPDSTIIIYYEGEDQNRLFVTSQSHDARQVLNKLVNHFGGKGGGVQVVAQGIVGKIANINSLKGAIN